MNKNRNDVMEPKTPQRNYKDTLFRMIFSERSALLSLYNAVNETDYSNPEELQIVTLENAIYLNMKNDLAFIVDCRMSLYEQQTTVNPNMPLRNLIYVAKEYQGMASNRSLYSSRLVKLPTPYFVVFYNGTQAQPERKEMKLSDAFLTRVEEPALELKVLQLNIGTGQNGKLKEKCSLLAQYAEYVERVQGYAAKLPFQEAVELAVTECIREGILADFLLKNRAEAIEVSIFEYDEEKEIELFRAAEREEGREEGRAEGRKEGREEGRNRTLVEQVCKKLRKGQDAERIADDLEVALSEIQSICNAALPYAPDYDIESVYSAWH